MTDQAPPDPDTGTRPFAAILQRINAGKTATELSLKVQDLIAAVESTGKPGKLQLTLTIEPAKNNSRIVTVAADVTMKAPARPQPSTVFFIDDGHNLRDSDPQQQELPGILEAVADPRPAPAPVQDPRAAAGPLTSPFTPPQQQAGAQA